jgi:short/branched chain acyl-CoA dehydrogenase
MMLEQGGPSMQLTPEQEAFRLVVRDFAAREVEPFAEEWDRDHVFPVDCVLKMGELGLFGLPIPEEFGGSGADFTTLCVAIEELGRVDQSVAITLEAGVGLGANPILKYGTQEQKEQWLPDLAAGRALGAFGLTEPEAGSDAGGTRTRAVLDDSTGEWILNGEKAFITNSGTPITSIITMTARTDTDDAAVPELSAIIVPSGTDGLEVSAPYRKMGWHASDTHGLHLADCRVPEANLLGARGRGFAQFLNILDEGRVAIAALSVGVIEGCLAHCLRYANDRVAFGRPIGANQAVAFKCADMAVMASAARELTYEAARLIDAGQPFKREAAVAKLYATEAAITATREATQIFGGCGFIDETPVSRFYRDSKILEIGEGSSEMQRLVIARGLGLPVA